MIIDRVSLDEESVPRLIEALEIAFKESNSLSVNIVEGNVYNQVQANLVFSKGTSLLVTVTPPTSNVAMPVSLSLTAKLYLQK